MNDDFNVVEDQGTLFSSSDPLLKRKRKKKRKRERSKSQPSKENSKPSKEDVKKTKKQKKHLPAHVDDESATVPAPSTSAAQPDTSRGSYANAAKNTPTSSGSSAKVNKQPKQVATASSSGSTLNPTKKKSKPIVFREKLVLTAPQERKFRNLRGSQERLSRFLLHKEFLQLYETEGLVPKALMLNLPPALGKSSKAIDQEWEDTLKAASLKLLGLTLNKIDNSLKECKLNYFNSLTEIDNDQSLSSDMKRQIKERCTQLTNRKEKQIRETKNRKWARDIDTQKGFGPPIPSPSGSTIPTGKKNAQKEPPKALQKGKALKNGKGGKKSSKSKPKTPALAQASESETRNINILAQALQQLIRK